MKKTLCLAVVFCSLLSLGAEMVGFDFRGSDGDFDFELNRGIYSYAGLTFTMSALDSEAILNATASGFGVNSPGADKGDQVEPQESIQILISSSVYSSILLESLTVGSWSGDDAAALQVGSGAPNPLVKGENKIGFEVLDQVLVFSVSAGNGVSLNGISLNVIPEPTSIGLYALAGCGIWIARFRMNGSRLR